MTQHERMRQSLRSETAEKIGHIRADLESTLNASLQLTQGIAAILHAHGRLSDDEFQDTAASLVAKRRDVRNLGIAYGTVVSQIYPLAGNEKAIGLDYRTNPKQWAAVSRAIETGETIVDGPLTLVQGGTGVISRTPVFRMSGTGQTRQFFGLVSIVIDLDHLLDLAGLHAPDLGLRVTLDTQDKVIFGDPALLERDPVQTVVNFPGGLWRLSAIPDTGWPQQWWRQDPLQSALGAAIILLIAAASFGAAMIWHHRGKLYASLQESERQYRQLLDTAPAAILLHRFGRIIFANNEAIRLLRASAPDEIVNRPVLDLIHPDYRPVVSDRIQALAKPGDEAVPLRQKLMAMDGSLVDVEVSSSAVMVDGQLTVLAIAIDTSRGAKAEAQRQAVMDDLQRSNDNLRQFTTATSHDLQEPLRQVATYVQMLERRYGTLLDQDGRDFIQYAVDGVMRMRRLLHDLGVYAQLQIAGAPLKMVDTRALLERILLVHGGQIQRLGARVTQAALPAIMGDEEQLEQLFGSLLDNSLRYCRAGVAPVIDIRAERQGPLWLFSFADNGIGIAPDYQASIFNVFTRLHGVGQNEGTGFGLAICRRIVERHGGRLWVESEPDKGATFFFTLPAA